MKEQKFKKGDYVKIAKDLGPYMSHFTSDKEAKMLITAMNMRLLMYVLEIYSQK